MQNLISATSAYRIRRKPTVAVKQFHDEISSLQTKTFYYIARSLRVQFHYAVLRESGYGFDEAIYLMEDRLAQSRSTLIREIRRAEEFLTLVRLYQGTDVVTELQCVPELVRLVRDRGQK